jgi:pimeloyl-ACP methyl ester carboxylesterase
VPPGLDKFYSQTLTWGGCQSYANDQLSQQVFAFDYLQCARLHVPLDYAKPDGPEITVGLLRKQSDKPAERIGALVLNPGGPGHSGMVAAGGMVADKKWPVSLAAKFDLVGFDQRGAGASQPQVRCLTDAEKDADRLKPPVMDTAPETVAAIESDNKEFAGKCLAGTGADMLANIGTRDVARDMDVLRSALGEKKLNYLGFVYGTRLGTSYAEAFPGNVRAMVLDGAVPPGRDRASLVIAQANGVKKAFDTFAAACAKNPQCPSCTSAGQAVAQLDNMLALLKKQPLAVGGRKLSYSDASLAIQQGLYNQNSGIRWRKACRNWR